MISLKYKNWDDINIRLYKNQDKTNIDKCEP